VKGIITRIETFALEVELGLDGGFFIGDTTSSRETLYIRRSSELAKDGP